MKNRLALLAATLAACLSTQAQIVLWNFNDSAVSPAAAENTSIGAPTLTLSGSNVDADGVVGNAFSDFSGTSHLAGFAGAFGEDAGSDAVVSIGFDSTGFSGLALSFDYRSESATGVTLSIPGISESGLIEDGDWHRVSFNLPASFDNNASASLVIHTYEFFGPRSNLAWEVDNMQLSIVPEPSTYAAVVALSLLGFAAHRKIRGQTRHI